MSSIQADLAMSWIETLIRREIERHELFIAQATAISGGKVALTRIGATTQEKYYGRLRGLAIAVNDYVICGRLGADTVILGTLQNSAPSSLSLEAALVAPSVNTPYVTALSDSSAEVTSNNDNSVRVVNIAHTFTLPTGTWTVIAFGVGLYHISTDGAYIGQRVDIDGQNGGEIDGRAHIDATAIEAWIAIPSVHEVTGRSGETTAQLEYRPRDSPGNTAYAEGGCLFVIAWRTA